jgi:hypothetical protein
MADLKLKAGVSATNALSTELNSLADAGRQISSAIDNSSNLDLYMDLELAVQYTSSAPTAGQKVAEVYLVPTTDGTNYAEGSTSITPQQALLVATFESRNGSTSAVERLASLGIPIPVGSFKLELVNTSGKTYASSGNTLKYRTYKLQAV